MKLVRYLSQLQDTITRLLLPFPLFNYPLTTHFVIVPVFFFFSSTIELLEFSEDRHPWESVEEKLNAIRYESLAVCLTV